MRTVILNGHSTILRRLVKWLVSWGDNMHRWCIGSSNLWFVIFFFNSVIKMRSVTRMRKCESIGFELEITAFQPFPYRLPTFYLAPSFLEVGWQWVGLKQPYVRNKYTRFLFLCQNKRKGNARKKKPTYRLELHPPFRMLVSKMAASLSITAHVHVV